MRPFTYLLTLCLLFISSQIFSQNPCASGFVTSEITSISCINTEGTIDLTINGGAGPFDFSWAGPFGFTANTEDITGIPVGTYLVVITDANGETCSESFTVIEEIDIPSCFSFTVNTDCNEANGLIFLSCDFITPSYSFLWSNGATTEDISGLSEGTYQVTITDVTNGCSEVETINVVSNYCDTVYINPAQVTVGNQIRVDFVVTDFDQIDSLQYTMHYDPAVLQLESIENFNLGLVNFNEFDFNTDVPGDVLLSWVTTFGTTSTLPDGANLYSLLFTPLTTDESEVFIDGLPWPVEIANSNRERLVLGTTPIPIIFNGNELSGVVYKDENGNCQNDGEIPLSTWPIQITDGTFEWNIYTNSDGEYSIVLADGIYDINITPVTENWNICNNNLTIDIGEPTIQDFGAVALLDCEAMEVDMGIPALLRCFENNIYLNYCNYGTIPATNAFLEIELDPEMSFVSSEITPSFIDGNLLTFELGDLAIGECGDFLMTILLDDNCDSSVLGQTHCTTATIFPNTPCDVDPLWDGASLELTGNCDGTNVNFIIENVGAENMTQASSFIVIEDQVMGQSIPEDFILAAGETLIISKPANGSTYYMSVNQVPNHPGQSNPSVAVEGCGNNAQGEFSLGMVTQYAMDDNDGFVDVECVQNVGGYDPNDKLAMLQGFGDEHFIDANTPMEYIIRFQNTGTFTAFNVVIEDELSPDFDITSIRPGASSHDYTFDVVEGRTMVFTFENINLPDSTADLEGSQGFISYKVDQLLDNPDGTLLENTADIFFDFNEPITTNTTFHTIGSDFITTSTFNDHDLNIENSISVYPNPSTDNMTFELEKFHDNLELQVFDITGRLITTKSFANEKIVLSKNEMNEGMYFYSIHSNGKQLSSGKFIFL